MTSSDLKELARDIIRKDKWWEILSRFINVLHINLFMVDHEGHLILPPEEAKYGGRLLTDISLGFDLLQDKVEIEKIFQKRGDYLESENHFKLHSFAIPIKISSDKIIAYMVLGPVIFNKREAVHDYQIMAQALKVDAGQVLDEINGIRVVSNVMMNSILDLLSEIIRDNVERSSRYREKEIFEKMNKKQKDLINDAIDEIYNNISFDEILGTLLDVALNITKAESGSIMVLSEDKRDLSVKVSRGLSKEKLTAALKVGEGIAGLAVKENTTFLINDRRRPDNRIEHLLRRPEIRESLIMPLKSNDKIIGVMNLHTKNDYSLIEENLENLKHLSKFLSSTIQA